MTGPGAFPSLDALRTAHNALLKRYREEHNAPAVLDDIEAFLNNGRDSGAYFDGASDRGNAQSMLDYWVTVLYRAQRDAPSRRARARRFRPVSCAGARSRQLPAFRVWRPSRAEQRCLLRTRTTGGGPRREARPEPHSLPGSRRFGQRQVVTGAWRTPARAEERPVAGLERLVLLPSHRAGLASVEEPGRRGPPEWGHAGTSGRGLRR